MGGGMPGRHFGTAGPKQALAGRLAGQGRSGTGIWCVLGIGGSNADRSRESTD